MIYRTCAAYPVMRQQQANPRGIRLRELYPFFADRGQVALCRIAGISAAPLGRLITGFAAAGGNRRQPITAGRCGPVACARLGLKLDVVGPQTRPKESAITR